MTDNNRDAFELMDRETWRAILEQSLEAEPEPPIRRRVRRYSVHGPCTLHYEIRRMRQSHTLNLTNVSLTGIMGKSPRDIPMDTEVEIHVPVEDKRFAMRGTVVHCTSTLGGYKVGIELSFPKRAAPSSGADATVAGSPIFRGPAVSSSRKP